MQKIMFMFLVLLIGCTHSVGLRQPASVSDYEKELLELYIGLAYSDTNNWFREKVVVEGTEFRPHADFAVERWGIKISRQLSKALEKYPQFQGTVYRGLRSGEFLQSLKEGDLFIEGAFMSTSSSQDVARIFTKPENLPDEEVAEEDRGPIMVIQSLTGHNIQEMNENEKEILFGTGTVFIVQKIVLKPSGKLSEVHFQELPPTKRSELQKKKLVKMLADQNQSRLSKAYGPKYQQSSGFKKDLQAGKAFWKEMKASGWLEKQDLSKEAYESFFNEGGG